MREAESPAFDFDQAEIEGRPECLDCVEAECARHDRRARVGCGRDEQECLANVVGHRYETALHEFGECGRSREVETAVGRQFRTRKLDGVQRVPTRGRVHSDERRSRERRTEPVGHDPADRAQAEWAEAKPMRLGLRLEAPCDVDTSRKEHPNVVCDNESAHGEGQRTGRRAIEPLRVVDCDEHLAFHCAERCQRREVDGSLVRGMFVGLAEQQRGFERAQLWPSQLRADIVEEWTSGVAETRVKEPRLGFGGDA